MGDNGNWWAWDEAAAAYVDTGILAKGGILYPSFLVDPASMHLIMAYQDIIAEEQFTLDASNGHLNFNYR
jgi:hypothetical protein